MIDTIHNEQHSQAKGGSAFEVCVFVILFIYYVRRYSCVRIVVSLTHTQTRKDTRTQTRNKYKHEHENEHTRQHKHKHKH